MRNLSSNNLLKCHLTYTVKEKVASPLIWWICQNMFNEYVRICWRLVLIKHWQNNYLKNVLWVKEPLITEHCWNLSVLTRVPQFPLVSFHYNTIRLILSTAFNFVSNYTVGCISRQRNKKENFVNGDEMPKWRLFVDWWTQKQGGKKSNYKLHSRRSGFSSCKS